MTGTEVDVYEERAAALEVRHNQVSFTSQQTAALRTMGFDKVTPPELSALLHFSQKHDLDPFARQVTMIPSWDGKTRAYRHSPHITIDGYLALAERTGRFIGVEGPYWCGQDGQWTDIWLQDEPPAAARVTIRYWDTRGVERTANGTVTYKDRVRRNKDGAPMALWASMPAEMLANGALRMAIRRGLPEALDTMEHDLRQVAGELDSMELQPVPVAKGLHAPRSFDPADPMGLDRLDRIESGEETVAAPENFHAEVPTDDAGMASDEGVAVRSQVQRIKMLQRALGISDEKYRAGLRDLYGVESSKALRPGQAAQLIRRFEDRLAEKQAAAVAASGEVVDGDVVDAELVDGDGSDPYEDAANGAEVDGQ